MVGTHPRFDALWDLQSAVEQAFGSSFFGPSPWTNASPKANVFKEGDNYLVTLELPGLEYYEGYATGVIPVEHAWLKYEGNVLDLTLKDDGKRQIIYGKSHVYSWEEVREGIFRNRCWAPIDPVALRQLRE